MRPPSRAADLPRLPVHGHRFIGSAQAIEQAAEELVCPRIARAERCRSLQDAKCFLELALGRDRLTQMEGSIGIIRCQLQSPLERRNPLFDPASPEPSDP